MQSQNLHIKSDGNVIALDFTTRKPPVAEVYFWRLVDFSSTRVEKNPVSMALT